MLEELVFFMLQRQFRLLLALCHPERSEGSRDSSSTSDVSQNDNTTIDEVARLAPWQKGKLTRQAKLFSFDKLLAIHKKLYEIEKAQKTGNLASSLAAAIDFLLLEI